MRDVDFVVEGNSQVLFSLGADLGDKKELGPLRFEMMHELKYLLAFPIVDSKPLFTKDTHMPHRRTNLQCMISVFTRFSHKRGYVMLVLLFVLFLPDV